jgi:protein-S-isoprenylcysteine O-methyltransferase Ste14
MKRAALALVRPKLAVDSSTSSFDVEIPDDGGAQEAGRRAQRDLADTCARVMIVALFTLMAVRIGTDFVNTGRLTGLLLLASETLVIVFTVIRRSPSIVDRSIRARVLTAISMMGPPLIRPSEVEALAPEITTVIISAVGLSVAIAGKMSLGRSFGLMPANRGIVSTGLYRLVRHPIYMGYLITHVGFLAANPTLWNATVLVVADLSLLMRAKREEQTLARDPAYRAYLGRVRWRVLPGAF